MDWQSLYGAIDFREITKKYHSSFDRAWNDSVCRWSGKVNLRFLALSSVGYQQLMKLSSQEMQGENLVSPLSQYLEDIAVIV